MGTPNDKPAHDGPAAGDAARARVLLFLAFLTSEDCRRAGHAFLEPERLAFELCRLWFDEIYAPGWRYLDGLKGDRSEVAARHFRSCFTADEYAALERFHRFFELRIDMLSSSCKARRAFPDNDAWRQIVRDAAYLLDDLHPDPDRLRRGLAERVAEWPRERSGSDLPALATWLERAADAESARKRLSE